MKELMKRSNARILLLEHQGTVSADTRIQGFTIPSKHMGLMRLSQNQETKGQTEIAMPAVRKFCKSVDTISYPE